MASNLIVFSTAAAMTLLVLFLSPLPTYALLDDDAIVKPLENVLASDFDILEFGLKEGLKQASPAITTVTITNKGVGPLTLRAGRSWHGAVKGGSYPSPINVNSSVKFVHQGTAANPPKPSKGGVIYVGPNAQGASNNCAWVLAWNTPDDGTVNKVYVEAGPSTDYPDIESTWENILQKLDAANGSSDKFHSTKCGTTASANITPKSTTPALAAQFKVGS